MEKIYVSTKEIQKAELENLRNKLIIMEKIGLSDNGEFTPKLVVEHINNCEEDKDSTKSASIKLIVAGAILAIISALLLILGANMEMNQIISVVVATCVFIFAGVAFCKAGENVYKVSQMKNYINEAIKYIKMYNPELLKDIKDNARVKK